MEWNEGKKLLWQIPRQSGIPFRKLSDGRPGTKEIAHFVGKYRYYHSDHDPPQKSSSGGEAFFVIVLLAELHGLVYYRNH